MKTTIVVAVLCLLSCRLLAQVSFNLSYTLPAGNDPNSIAVADVNGDGGADLICANYYGNTLSVFTNNGNGGFVLSGTYNSFCSYPVVVIAADVNADGKPDLICAGSSLTVLTNNGAGGFALSGQYAVNNGPAWVTAADVNGDGKVDLITANWGGGSGNTLTVLTNNGSGGFVIAASPVAGYGPNCVTAVDVNGDGWVDLVSVNRTDNTVSALTNNGGGGFVLSGAYPVGTDPYFAAAADVNGDGKMDLICANWGAHAGNTLTVLTNNGSGGFGFNSTLTVGTGAVFVAAADINGDGAVDLICANNTAQTLSVLTNDSSGGFVLAASLSVGGNPNCVVALDVNGDGELDLISASYLNNVLTVWTNATPFLPVAPPTITAQPLNITNLAGTTATFTVGASGGGLAYLWQFNGTNLPAATNNPLILPNLTLSQAGDYSVFVSNTLGSTNSLAATLTVLASPPIITAQPVNQTVQIGGAASFTATVGGASPFFYQWNFNGSDIAGATSATLTLTNVQSSQAGNYAVSVTNEYGSTVSSNAALSVTATLDHFVWDPISSPQNSSQPFNVSITAKNIYGVTATSFNGTAGLSASGSGGGTTSTIVISEIDPNTPDFIEFMNVSANSVDMSGWHITIYDSSYPSPLINFAVPTNTIVPSSGVFRVTEFGTAPGTYPNFFIGININWTASVSTPIAVLVRDASGSIVDFACVGAAVSASISNPVTISTNQWSGGSISGNSNGSNNYQRIGNRDHNNSNDWVTASPSPGQTNAGLTSPFVGGSSSISISPMNSGSFVNGVWNGSVTVQQSATNVVLMANDGNGHAGSSNPFNVISPAYITAQPTNRTVLVGGTATFSVTATGTAPLSYQWSVNGTDVIAGATNSTLTLANVQISQDGSYYSVLVANAAGSTNSVAASLAVVLPPTITQQPQSQSVASYNSASFTVAATGSGPLGYQWRKGGTNLVDDGNISGSTTTNLTLASVGLNDAGSYDVVVGNPYAATNSAVAVLTVPQTTFRLASTNGMSGVTVVVPVFMNAVGDENAYQASVGYDPAKLVLQSIQPGPASAGAYLQEVDGPANSGYAGFIIILSSGSTQPAGNDEEVADLVFSTLPVTNDVTVNLTFGDNPMGRQVVDINGYSLPAVYQNGTVALTLAEYAADVSPRPTGNHQVDLSDWVEIGKMVAGLDTPTNSDEMLRADCAPRGAPDGVLTVADWVQAGRYESKLDPWTVVTTPPASGSAIQKNLKPIPPADQGPSRILQIGSVAAQRGQTVSVPVQLVCAASENAVGLTVSYDTNRLKLTGVTMGSAMAYGNKNINSNQPGKVGMVAAMMPNTSLAAGTNQILVLQFATFTNASGPAALTLDSSVVQLQVADKMANALSANYVSGVVVLPPQPVMTSVKAGDNLQLTWPISTGTFHVESAVSPLGPWGDAGLTITTNGASATVTVAPNGQQQFFRLVGQ